MANKVEDLVNVILDSYKECDITARIDEENMLNKDILIEIIDEIRKVLFPGFFDNNKVRSEYLKFLVGERLEFIQYHLKKQVSNKPGWQKNLEKVSVLSILMFAIEDSPVWKFYFR